MSKYSWIIVVVIIVWQVIASALQNAAKKKQAEQAMAVRARARAIGGGPTQVSTSTSMNVPASPTQVARGQDLASRRKAQLEELRRRRQQRVAGPATGSPQPRPAAPQTTAPATAPARPPRRPATATPIPAPVRASMPSSRSQVKTVAAEYGAIQASDEAERQRRANALKQSHAAEAAHERRREKEVTKQREEPRPAVVEDPYAIDSGTGPSRLVRILRSRQAIRDAFIMKELLEPPLALREQAPGYGT